jgi:ankyrin repeat protein
MIELLVLNGADVNGQNESGKTALMIAAYNGSYDIVTMLRDFGALYEKADKTGSYAINYAAECENAVTLEWMLNNGAKTDWK